ncbi:MAG: sulfatase-like hydrolase/transferase [Planctomycetaceae bacterium]|nr:sulfatase-like hydrolase/transferase [Planctomycetaceae bacterium]
MLIFRIRTILLVIIFLTGLIISLPNFLLGAVEKNDLPNIVFIFADDMGYGDVSLLNEKSKIKTPHLDSLGQQGMVFTDAHAACSVCGPSRYAVITGRYPMRNHKKATNNNTGFGLPVLESGRLTVAQMLKEKGYDTVAFGKWHLGMTWATQDGKPLGDPTLETEWQRIDYTKSIKDSPLAQGFDYYFGIPASLDMVPYVFIENDQVTEIPATIKQNDPPRPGPAGEKFEPIDVLPILTEKSINYIREHGINGKRYGNPFFIYLPLNAPHTPLVPTKDWQGKTVIGDYGDYCSQVDNSVGKILAAIDQSSLGENTLVIFTTDNGFAPYLKPKNYEEKGHFPSYIYRGYKGDIYDGGHRVPFFIRWSGKIRPYSVSNELIGLVDFFATCAEIVDFQLPDHAAEDSVSFLPILLNKESAAKRTDIVHLSPKNQVSIREGTLKLIVPANTGQKIPQWKTPPLCELYDMSIDPSEKNNLAKEKPEIVAKMFSRLETILENGRSTPGTPQKNNSDLQLYKP